MPAVGALQILAWSLIPGTLSIYLSLDLLARGEERVYFVRHSLQFLRFGLPNKRQEHESPSPDWGDS